MGGNTGFCRRVSHLRRNPHKTTGELVFVDASVLDYRVRNSNKPLATKVFKSTSSTDLNRIVASYATGFEDQLIHAQLSINDRPTIVFEGGSAKSDRRASRLISLRAKRLNHAIRMAFRPGIHPQHKSVAQKTIASYMGRPPLWFTTLVSDELRRRGWSTVICPAPLQADHYILHQAQHHQNTTNGRKVIVISNDRDFLALDKTNSIHAIRYFNTGSLVEITKTDVLAECSDCTPTQLRNAYCFSGCDDMRTKIDGLGFSTALKLAMVGLSALEEGWRDESVAIIREIRELEGMISGVPSYMERGVDDQPNVSMLDVFLDEKHPDGTPRRAKLAEKVRGMLSNSQTSPTNHGPQKPPHTRNQRIREENRRIAERTKKIPFLIPTHNVFAALETMEKKDSTKGKQHNSTVI